jgi:hypothetical protein
MEEGREPRESTTRDPRGPARDDSFGRILGDEWVAVEPGIYRLVSDLQAEAERERRRQQAESLEESLLDELPRPPEDTPPVRPEEPVRSGRWWRRH